MNGLQFYDFLHQTFQTQGVHIYGNNNFHDWLLDRKTNTYSFQFRKLNKYNKSISRDILIAAWNANHKITDAWLLNNFGIKFHGDCRLAMLNYLLRQYSYLRTLHINITPVNTTP